MSNRNFDSRVIIQRLQHQNYARNLYDMNTRGQTLIANPQNSDGAASQAATFSAGSQTQYFRGLLGAGDSVSLGGFADLIAVAATAPSRATITQITAGDQQLVVSFNAPTSTGGASIINYQYSVDNGATFVSAGTTTSPLVITGLTNGVAYQVVIRAANIVGYGVPSLMVEGTPSTVPDAPTGLSGTAGNQQISVTFSGGNGGSAITNYEYSTDNGATYLAFNPVDTSSPVTITTLSSDGVTALTNGTPYTVRLKAVNANGVSTASAPISVTPVSVAVPPAPTALSGVGGNQAIYVLFTQSGVGGGPITNYEYSVDGGAYVACSPAQTFSPVLITTTDGTTALTNGVSYSITLKAVNGGGASPASASTSVTPTTNTLLGTNLIVELDANNSSSYSGGATWTNLRSSGAYSASLQNNPAFDGTNKYFTFDGVNQVAQIAAATAINPTAGSSFTVQIWARVNRTSPQFSAGDGLISKQYYAPSYDGYSLGLNNNTGGVALNMNGGSVNGNYGSAAGVYDNGWALYTIVVRFGGGSGNPSYAYVSGRRVITAANAESSMPSQAPLQFPRGFQDGSYNFCPADVGAFYLYNAAVSQEDIIRNYDATKARYT